MSLVWEQRIQHFDRPIKRSHYRYLKSGQRKSVWRATRGLPSRNRPWALMAEELRHNILSKHTSASQEELKMRRMRLEWELMRSRLLERKRRERAMIRHRKVTADRTCINLWKRRRDWLKMVASSRARE